MASPTFAEKATQLKNAVGIAKDLNATAATLRTDIDTLEQSLEGDWVGDAAASAGSVRSSYDSIFGKFISLLAPHFQDLAKVINSNQTDPATLMDSVLGDLFQYFITNSQSVNSRNITFGSVSAGGSNVGTGTVYRLKTDRNSQDIEACAMSTKLFKCISDQNTGTNVGEEVFSVEHQSAWRDNLDWGHHGQVDSMIAKGPENGLGVRNMSFEEIDGAVGALNTIPGWTIVTGTINTNLDYSTTTFASSPTEKTGTAYSLKITGNAKITQTIRSQSLTLNPLRPYFVLLHYNRAAGAGDGTLTMRMGTNATASVVLAAQAGWNVLITTMNQNLWYKNFVEDDLNLEVEISGNTTGYTLVDYMIFDSMDFFDGLWYAIVGGATYFLRDDQFTFADSLTAAEGIIQYWLYRLFGYYLPHNNAGTETVTDP